MHTVDQVDQYLTPCWGTCVRMILVATATSAWRWIMFIGLQLGCGKWYWNQRYPWTHRLRNRPLCDNEEHGMLQRKLHVPQHRETSRRTWQGTTVTRRSCAQLYFLNFTLIAPPTNTFFCLSLSFSSSTRSFLVSTTLDKALRYVTYSNLMLFNRVQILSSAVYCQTCWTPLTVTDQCHNNITTRISTIITDSLKHWEVVDVLEWASEESLVWQEALARP